MASAHNVPCVVTNSLETAIGRAGALHAAALLPEPALACGLATEGFFTQDVSGGVLTMNAMQAVPSGPGLGVTAPAVDGGPRPLGVPQ
jgi:L-alanine-DL-glutamate epimerase-like enolase superfamily enzyme